jgi:hypothetical protein
MFCSVKYLTVKLEMCAEKCAETCISAVSIKHLRSRYAQRSLQFFVFKCSFFLSDINQHRTGLKSSVKIPIIRFRVNLFSSSRVISCMKRDRGLSSLNDMRNRAHDGRVASYKEFILLLPA